MRTWCHLRPFVTNPLSVDISISPLQIAYSRTGKPRVVVDLSYPPGQSVNCGIPRDTYHCEPFSLHLPGLDALLNIIRQKGQHCHLFKTDLSRQLWINPRDYHLLGYQQRDSLYFDIAPPFGLRSLAIMCQTTTSAVTFMYQNLGYSYTNYIDDFGEQKLPLNQQPLFRPWETVYAASDWIHLLIRIPRRPLQWSFLAFS